jgi:hypothetical protein
MSEATGTGVDSVQPQEGMTGEGGGALPMPEGGGRRPPGAPVQTWIPDTYRYIRLITPLPAIWLLLAIAAVGIWRHQLLDSISDYYGGPLRDVFVGALVASAVGMIAYKGHSKLEDYALNFAGVNAIFVALVSNSFRSLLDTTRAAERDGIPVLVGSKQLLENLKIATVTLLAVGVVFVFLDMLLMHWTKFSLREQTGLTRVLVLISWVAEIVLLAMVVCMLMGMEVIVGRSAFSSIHFVAATLLVVNLSFAAASHGFPSSLRKPGVDAPEGSQAVQKSFRVITLLMWGGVFVGGFFIWQGAQYAVIGTEVWEIILFVFFWFIATRTEWERG